ncbi:MAG: aldo/keto reductase [Victivallales bacterium]|jgi:aryl-alcohol dehydrogenase-like predicted oxidoreductase|nr:aldo/keto reductase [Victivallales bacterium]MBT7165930.1 aldo/keto reductase [Victivallales bacterium]
MMPTVRLGRTELQVTRIALGGYPFGGVNHARGWDPFTPEGRQTAIRTIHAALDAGISIVDTAPGYGNGNSESIFGEATQDRRDGLVLATKVGYRGTPDQVRQSVEASLMRLRTDVIDIIQFHGGAYTGEEVDHILNHGMLDMLEQLRQEGKVRFLGFTVEEPWTARPLIASGRFDVMQVRYNLIYQAAALHVLDQAREADMGISVMRPMTSGIMQRLASYIASEWQSAQDIFKVALRFVLADSRVHVANVGMRWPEEVAANVALAETFVPAFDMAQLPRMTAKIYQTDDQACAQDQPETGARGG